jgi:hypothetical protein
VNVVRNFRMRILAPSNALGEFNCRYPWERGSPCLRPGLEESRVESFLQENSADVRAEADAKLEPVRSPDIAKEGRASAPRGTDGFRGIGGCPSELRRSAILPLALSAEEICGAWVRA